ncbi:MAG: hypothetical protein ABIR37_03040 [Candidatus Saccharimonadales bacterium]
MSSKKLYFVLLGLILLLGIGTIAGAYETDQLLQQRSNLLVEQKAASVASENQQTQLAKNKKDITKYKDLNTIAKTIVPQDKDQAQAVLEIVRLAQQSNIPRLSSVTFPTSTLGAKPLTGATATTTPVPTANNKLTQLIPVKGITGVYDLQITIQQSENAAVPYSTFIAFLQNLEQNRRTAQVSNISVTPSSKNPNLVAFTLIIDEYIKP